MNDFSPYSLIFQGVLITCFSFEASISLFTITLKGVNFIFAFTIIFTRLTDSIINICEKGLIVLHDGLWNGVSSKCLSVILYEISHIFPDSEKWCEASISFITITVEGMHLILACIIVVTWLTFTINNIWEKCLILLHDGLWNEVSPF